MMDKIIVHRTGILYSDYDKTNSNLRKMNLGGQILFIFIFQVYQKNKIGFGMFSD